MCIRVQSHFMAFLCVKKIKYLHKWNFAAIWTREKLEATVRWIHSQFRITTKMILNWWLKSVHNKWSHLHVLWCVRFWEGGRTWNYLFVYAFFFQHSFFAFFSPQNHSFPLINILLLKMTDWFAHIIIMCECAVCVCLLLNAIFSCWLAAMPPAQDSQIHKTNRSFHPQPAHFFLLHATKFVYHDACKWILCIICQLNVKAISYLLQNFFRRHRVNSVSWMQTQLTWTTKLLYTRHAIVLYTPHMTSQIVFVYFHL